MINQIDIVHKSHMNRSDTCREQLYIIDIVGYKPTHINETALAGKAIHRVCEELHKDKTINWDDSKLQFEKFVEYFRKEKENSLRNGIEVQTKEDIKAEDYLEMLIGYMSKDYNRYAEPIILEKQFYFEIKQGKKVYKFAGTIDQLLKIPTKYLNGLGLQTEIHTKDYVYIHRDLKSGKRNGTSDFNLSMNNDINVYAYALAFGLFDLDEDGICEKRIQHIPFAHALYFLQDHKPYKNSNKKYNYKEGDERGPGMYFSKRSLEDLQTWVPKQLIQYHKEVNSGSYTRTGMSNDMCDNYCGVKDICFKRLVGKL